MLLQELLILAIFSTVLGMRVMSRLSEHEAFAVITDSYRMRLEDEHNFDGHASGLYAKVDPLPDFVNYLNKVENIGDILPAWWSEEKRDACVKQAMIESGWSVIRSVVDKTKIIDHYKDSLMPMRLRMLAERAVGRRVGT